MKLKLICLVLGMALFATGCLKTRSQVKEDQESAEPAKSEKLSSGGQYDLDEIKNEITHMSGRLEDIERNQKTRPDNTASSEEVKKLETRIGELESAQANMLEAIKKIQADQPLPDSVDLFSEGKKQFTSGDFDKANETFTQYLKNPKGKYVQDAHFFRGESLFNLRKYNKAILDYSKFTETFHDSKYLQRALYKIALSFEAMGMQEDALAFYQELSDKFPKSPEGKIAAQKLGNGSKSSPRKKHK